MPLALFFHRGTICCRSQRYCNDFVQFLARLQILTHKTGKVCPVSIASKDATRTTGAAWATAWSSWAARRSETWLGCLPPGVPKPPALSVGCAVFSWEILLSWATEFSDIGETSMTLYAKFIETG